MFPRNEFIYVIESLLSFLVRKMKRTSALYYYQIVIIFFIVYSLIPLRSKYARFSTSVDDGDAVDNE